LEPNLSTQLDLQEAKIKSELFFINKAIKKKKQAIYRFISQISCWHHVGIIMTKENMLDK
jgi:sensor domain CHASE-containing protein